MTNPTKSFFTRVAVGTTVLTVGTFVATIATVFSLLDGDVNLAKAWAVTASLGSTFLQLALVGIGMKHFNIWRRQQETWASEWALIQQEIGRRREQGGWS